jgi:hypothetical protein
LKDFISDKNSDVSSKKLFPRKYSYPETLLQVVKDIGLDATDEKIKDYVWSLLKSGQVKDLHALLTES